MRIIHVVENLDKGAIENWLVRTFLESRKIRSDWHWTFYCILGKEGRLDAQVRAAGGEIIYSPVTIDKKVSFLKHLRSTLKHGNFDILHIHHDYLSGYHLIASIGIKFSKRIVHLHNTARDLPVGNFLLKRFLLQPFRRIVLGLSTHVVGISENTLADFIGTYSSSSLHAIVLYCGIDLSVFDEDFDTSTLKAELDIPSKGDLLLFVGTMDELKNPVFLVDVLDEVLKQRPEVYALFVGKGGELAKIERRAKDLRVYQNIRLLGWRNDIPRIMKSADLFVFPRVEHIKEGLGLVIVEAQAAGLPVIMSYSVVEDAIVVKEIVSYVSLNNNPEEWAKKVSDKLQAESPLHRSDALKIVKSSPFELKTATKNLVELYES